MILGGLLLIVNGVVEIPPINVAWDKLLVRAEQIAILGGIAEISGISVAKTAQVIFSIVILPVGGLLGFLLRPYPRINPPDTYDVNENYMGREDVMKTCKKYWNEIAVKKAKRANIDCIMWQTRRWKNMDNEAIFLKDGT